MQPGMPGGLGIDLSHLLLQAQKLQHEMERAQRSLAERTVTGTSGGDLVRATLTGDGELVGLEIDPEAVDPADTETLADLIIAAVRDARRQVQELSSGAMGEVSDGFDDLASGFGLPGLAD